MNQWSGKQSPEKKNRKRERERKRELIFGQGTNAIK
jgi:hypothetical protein